MEKLFKKFVNTTKALRGAGGCPWDKKQTHESLIKCLREESEEVVQAIENKDFVNLQEELGDLLLQVVFHANLAEEEGKFTINDVIKGIDDKLIRRHPHVFGSEKADTPEESLALWKKMKAKEKEAKK
ncbi:Protein containing tetrapyrrole methyltransferase domain and MazG-like (predicted pyrophosphatase) domain [Elusimicrobium minutum Pei191]|uniref:Protein containing tetrapyrrole methyltransferase domain and MazG-like (Predicted pyrophosphatase) domain n=1 Tax=Elusimicrobium minutum (strain Pei191) TaxID=445932 RepID=B2KAT1_ELUMP|nr:MazG family protein [Elusimicrobium minutum]ACC97627.1 Protein containing tetrapyrrole methyltransferase domain and MazG-like (predicted pyrophosphatase) domain [Elusimicrobium minutum Pei191]